MITGAMTANSVEAMDGRPLTDRLQRASAEVLERGVLARSGPAGIYASSKVFDDLIEAIRRAIGKFGAQSDLEAISFPPVMSRSSLEKAGYHEKFPHLLGAVASRAETSPDTEMQRTDLVLTPAACYPLYPLLAERGRLPQGGLVVGICSFCFRQECSEDIARMRAFRQQEYVCVGSPAEVEEKVVEVQAFAVNLMAEFGLDATLAIANDAFFGREGQLRAEAQRLAGSKLELSVHVSSEHARTACVSINRHGRHFGESFGLETSNGEVADTACIGFGLERIALALLNTHGPAPATWPRALRQAVGFGPA